MTTTISAITMSFPKTEQRRLLIFQHNYSRSPASRRADTFLPPTDMHSATTQSTTTDIIVNLTRVI
jgi:hypothetical protein